MTPRQGRTLSPLLRDGDEQSRVWAEKRNEEAVICAGRDFDFIYHSIWME